MRLRTAFRWVVFTGLATSLLHVITVAVLPWLVMFRVQEATGDVWGYNRMTRVEAVDAETRFIPRPDPHMAYSVCPFDLSKGPLRVVYGAMADHASVTAYGGDTENFLTIAGAELTPGEVVLATPEQAARLDGPATVAPGQTGIVLVRRLVRTPDDWPEAERERASVSCGPAL